MHVLAIHTQPVVGGVAHLGVVLPGGLDVGADAAEPEQVGLRAQQSGDEGRRLHRALLRADDGLHFLAERDALEATREDAATLADQRLVIVVPARAWQLEQACALLPAHGRIGIGIDEDVTMVEGGHKLDGLGQQHAVAEDVARHVANADDADALLLHVDSHLGEMALDADPGAARSDAHRLVVIAIGAAAGEGIAQPELALDGQPIGHVGEGGRALVGGDDEIGIVPIPHDDALGMHHLAFHDVVRDREQGADEHAIALRAFREPGVAIGGGVGQLLGVEAALGAGRHDDRVLHALGLHQAEDFRAEVVAPVRPAQAAACHAPGAQVNALDPRRIDPDLTPGQRLGQARHRGTVDLEGERLLRCRCEGVSAQRRLDDGAVEAQNAVVVEAVDLFERTVDLGVERLGVIRISGPFGIVQGKEQVDQQARNAGLATQ